MLSCDLQVNGDGVYFPKIDVIPVNWHIPKSDDLINTVHRSIFRVRGFSIRLFGHRLLDVC